MPQASLISAALISLAGLGFVLLLGYSVLLVRCFGRLRDRHPEIYAALDRPTGFGTDLRIVFPARRFLWSDACRALGDDVLTAEARWAYVLGTSGATLVALPIVLGFVFTYLIA